MTKERSNIYIGYISRGNAQGITMPKLVSDVRKGPMDVIKVRSRRRR